MHGPLPFEPSLLPFSSRSFSIPVARTRADAYGTVDTAAFNLPDAAAVNGSDLTKEQYAAAEATKVAAIGLYQAAGFPTYRDANSDGFPDDWRPRVTLAQSKVSNG